MISCANERRVLKGQKKQLGQLSLKVDSAGSDTVVAADSVVAGDTIVVSDAVVTAADRSEEKEAECDKLHRTIYNKNGRTIFFETEDCMVYCYTQKGNKPPRKVAFEHEYVEDSFPRMYSRVYGEKIFVVGDIMPNSNGWTVKFQIYKINAKTLKITFVDEAAAVHFGKDGFKIAQCRLTNPDAGCTTDERWVMHNTYYNSTGRKIREDRREYDYKQMEEEYGDTLVNALRMGHFGGE